MEPIFLSYNRSNPISLPEPGTLVQKTFKLQEQQAQRPPVGHLERWRGGLFLLIRLDSWMNVFYLLRMLNHIMAVGSTYMLHLKE